MSVACSNTTQTTTTDTWKDKSFAAAPMKSIVVFGAKMEPTSRRTLEDSFVSALAPNGVHVTQSYTLFPGTMPSKDEAHAAVQRGGFDGLLVATQKGITEKQTVVPSDGFWDGYYGAGWAGDPGYVVTDDFVKFETTLWNPAGSGKMVWSSITQTKNPTSGQDFATSLTKNVVPALVKAGLVPPAGTAMSSFTVQ